MARSLAAKGKNVRKFGQNIYGQDKFDRLLARRSNPPGQHGSSQGRRRVSDYGRQLLAKQKLKNIYGLLERQFRRTFNRAQRQPGVTGDNLLTLLELRFDNAVYRAGFAATRMQARQLITHGHLRVNDRKVDRPSFELRLGDRVSVRDTQRSQILVSRLAAERPLFQTAAWIAVDREDLCFSLKEHPETSGPSECADVQLIVEYYSR